jgi:hypothetical protein
MSISILRDWRELIRQSDDVVLLWVYVGGGIDSLNGGPVVDSESRYLEVMGESGRASRDAHISKSRYGAPGKVSLSAISKSRFPITGTKRPSPIVGRQVCFQVADKPDTTPIVGSTAFNETLTSEFIARRDFELNLAYGHHS